MATRRKGARARLLIAALAVSIGGGLTPQSAIGQTVRGLVLESRTSQPINLASVVMIDPLGDTVATALTDPNGFFSVTAQREGSYEVVAGALSFQRRIEGPFVLQEGGLQVVQVVLEPEPIAVAGLDVESEAVPARRSYLARQGFYNREQLGIGRFLGPAMLEREQPLKTYTYELFLGMPGVFAGESLGTNGVVQMRETTGGRCSAALFVDGVRVRELPELEALEAVEVYTRPVQVPLQYQTVTRGCGIVLFWTKR